MSTPAPCEKCKGTGFVWVHVRLKGTRYAADWQELCSHCQGSGMAVKRTPQRRRKGERGDTVR